jgi:uncharacterized iron-regulated membrane protein
MSWRKIHKWLGLLIGIQILMWVAGGVYMSAMPLSMVHGNHLINDAPKLENPPSSINFAIDLSGYRSVRWIVSDQKWIVEAVAFSGDTVYFDPTLSEPDPLGIMDKSAIERIALSRYAGSAITHSIEWISEPPSEASGISDSVYRVDFDDWVNTTFYLHATTGEVLKVRSDIWRLFDIFWMLHIMDYEHREDFNNPLLIASAVLSLAFLATGMMLLIVWGRKAMRHKRALS